MSKSRLVLAALVDQAAAAQIPLSETCSNLPRCLGEIPILRPPGTDGGPTKSPPLIIGIIVDPTRKADPRDPNCPSGHCIIVDPKEICDGSQPNCLPFANIRQPSLPCKKKLPKCPSGGILIDPEISCHLLDTRCPPVEYMFLSHQTPILFLDVVDVPKWPPADDERIPGVPFDPKKICSATTPGCQDGGVVVPWEPDDECDARFPGCLAINIPYKPIDGTGDPACPPPSDHACRIINPVACHPNQPNPLAGCLKVDPIPCSLGTPGCNSGVLLPDPIQKCVPLSIGCSKDGIRLSHTPSSSRGDPVVSPGNQALIVDPKGKLKCSFKSVSMVAPITPETVTMLSKPETIYLLGEKETVTAACPSSKLSSQKPTPPASTTTKKPSKSSTKPSIATDYSPAPSSEAGTPKIQIIKRTITETETFTESAAPSPKLPPASSSIKKPAKPSTKPVVADYTIAPPSSVSMAQPTPPGTVGTPEIIKRTVTETVTHSTTPSPISTPKSTPTPVPTPSTPPKSLSKFACSTSDTKPCLGAVHTPWAPFLLYHTTNTNPYPYNTQIHNPENHDLILTVTDDLLRWEIFTVRLDGQILGDTSEHTPNWFESCGTNADSCIERGWSHGYFKIPPGTHDLNIQWTRGGYWIGYSPAGTGMGNSGGQWRLSKSCTC